MREEVFKIHKYPLGHKVDKQLLVSIKDIFLQYDEHMFFEIKTECTNDTACFFEDIDECFEYFEKKTYRIVKMSITGKFKDNQVTLIFDNGTHPNTEIKFQFDNGDDYLLLKNKIELCLSNFKLNYRILSRLPIMTFLLGFGMLFIFVYTNVKNIIFPELVQISIMSIWTCGIWITISLSSIRNIKRNLFPCTEFCIGQNIRIEEKNEKIRNFIFVTIILTIILGIIVNLISGFLF